MKTILISLFVFTPLYFLLAQPLNPSQKKEWKKALKVMVKSDQEFRSLMVRNPAFNNDSIWKLQSISDSINKSSFIQLTEKYGFPSLERIGNQSAVLLLLHFTLKPDFEELLPLFEKELKKGNMPPFEFAVWFDRCQVNMELPNKYGVYGKKEFCQPELDHINASRIEIGLGKLREAADCK